MRQEFLKPEKRVVSFGKYAGKKYSEVPTDYLRWFARNAFYHMANRRQWAIDELKRRENAPNP